ncbi:MAG: hypothetical protein F6J90_02290 [Moorea sp. SIOASIH]|uniref:hypothetical protein n=1 Tax=Moorena sp. SIOASIH TaxID=2607817 RepID=UPI0013B5BD54|nr:hypothetical protein [Moorena sp. SIOASIH]NEO35200.1 hypothetical protein [Moorena sp. SIOASIH]
MQPFVNSPMGNTPLLINDRKRESGVGSRESGRWGDGAMGRWGDGEMGRWGDGAMGRWGDGAIFIKGNYPDII